jgi:type IX secretion system PorP/SprF family membrane protein
MKTKIKITIFLVFSVLINLNAQQVSLFSNYITNKYGFNPAIAGSQQYTDIRLIHRAQWVGYEGRPATTIASINAPVGKFGIGGYLYTDEAGALKKSGGSATVAYHLPLDTNTTLRIGLAGGFYQVRLKDNLVQENPNDPLVQNGQLGTWTPDFAAGIQLDYKRLTLGFSVPQILAQKISFQDLNTVRTILDRHYYAYGSYDIPLNNSFKLEPTVLFKHFSYAPIQMDYSLRGIFSNGLWVGGSYRTQDAFVLGAGLEARKFVLAYAYDITRTNLRLNSAGSHEITLGLKLGAKGDGDRDKDSVKDKDDPCPDVPGPVSNKGCPNDENSDRDKDTVLDKDDPCPDVPGPVSNKGCPALDKDNDGIRDDIDKCPEIPGTMANEGCPQRDRDKDGIMDDIDPCPDVFGSLKNQGCPDGTDRDKDGVEDANDPCPDVAGPKSNSGCPIGDRDNDGVRDEFDKCPNTFGTLSNNGCPEVNPEQNEAMELAIRNLYFDTDKWDIKSNSFKYLNNLITILRDKKDWKVRMTGHADKRGDEDHNRLLSKNRVNVVKNYFISRGIEPSRLITDYYGSTKPAAPNTSAQYLQLNRRVEMEFIFE